MAKEFVITKEQVEAKAMPGCPGMKLFEGSPLKQGDKLVFPNGFTDEEAIAMARRNPFALRFLARNNLVPMTLIRAKEIIAQLEPKSEEEPARRRGWGVQ